MFPLGELALSFLWCLNADKSAEQQASVFPSGPPSSLLTAVGLGRGLQSVSASSLHPTAKFMGHADANSVAPWEEDWELAEEFYRSELCSWAIEGSFIWWDFKRLHALLSAFIPHWKLLWEQSTRHILECIRIFSTSSFPVLWRSLLIQTSGF